MSSETDPSTKKKRGIPWYVYFVGSSIYTALGGWLAAETARYLRITQTGASAKYHWSIYELDIFKEN